ncbi:MAG: mechanosensitive ion channel [Clostridia bacterium]|nr:mechanosensitive ion channel [Clostridia bacterium]
MDWQALWNNIVHWAATAGVRLLIALVVLFVSFKLINLVARRIERSANRKNADKTIMRTVAYIFKLGMKIVIAICLVGYVGIDTSGLTALVTSLGVCVGLAVNGALSNLAGGVLIIITRPFRIDDYIEAQGYSGTVEEIHITNTKLRTPDNKVVFIPNGALSTGSVVNYSMNDTRRVDEVYTVAYSADFKRAKDILADIYDSHPLVLKDPAPFIRVTEHASSSINITTRVWVKSEDYWTVKFDVLEAVKERFDAEGIEIPFPQMDVHVKND